MHDARTGQQLGVLDLSTTWDRAHPIGPAMARALARLVEHEARPTGTQAPAGQSGVGPGRDLLDLRLLGRAGAWLYGRPLRITRRQMEILALLALSPEGLDLGELHARLYGDRPVRPATLKAEMSQLRAMFGERLTSRPYRIDVPVRCDVIDVLDRLRTGDVAGAAERYDGELLPWSESPALIEYGNFVTVALRTALLADPQPAAVLRYTQRAPTTWNCSSGVRQRPGPGTGPARARGRARPTRPLIGGRGTYLWPTSGPLRCLRLSSQVPAEGGRDGAICGTHAGAGARSHR